MVNRANLFDTLHASVAAWRRRSVGELRELSYPQVREFLRGLEDQTEQGGALESYFGIDRGLLQQWDGMVGQTRFQQPSEEEVRQSPELEGTVLATAEVMPVTPDVFITFSLVREGGTWHFLSAQVQTRSEFEATGVPREDL